MKLVPLTIVAIVAFVFKRLPVTATVAVAVAFALSVKLVFAAIAVTVVLFGMPLPATYMPTASPVVFTQVTVGLVFVVPHPVSHTRVLASRPTDAFVAVAFALMVKLVLAVTAVMRVPLVIPVP